MVQKYRVEWQGHKIYMNKKSYSYLVERKRSFPKGKTTRRRLTNLKSTKLRGFKIYMNKRALERWKEELTK